MKKSEIIIEIAKALCAAQQMMKPALKDKENPYFRSSYSDLSSVWESIRIPLTSNGLSILQEATTADKSVSVTTLIMHNSGQWIEFEPFSIPLLKQDPQTIGSATSYAKRYALCAALGVVSNDEDDDGEKAMGREKEKKSKPEPVLEKISRREVEELCSILADCSPDYQKSVKKSLEEQNISDYSQITPDLFQRIKRAGLLKRDAYLNNRPMVAAV